MGLTPYILRWGGSISIVGSSILHHISAQIKNSNVMWSEKGCAYFGFLTVSVKSQAGLGLVLARRTFWVSRRRALVSAAAAAAWAAARLA